MMYVWDWIEEGRRVKEQARGISGLTEDIRSESIVFRSAGDRPAGETVAPATKHARPCREDGFCDAVYAENHIGGEARQVVGLIAKAADVQLSPNPLDGNVWSPRNMMRVVEGVQRMAGEIEALRKEQHDLKDNGTKTVAALREALIHAGEAV
ncbi:hypothetical protein [Streptomyces sp. NPDC051546]|uniref:hypothetical protein n=1 Tax=Streptomyces sp. NPDC051546 TaxID=3365655 RepID=UPI0037A447B7